MYSEVIDDKQLLFLEHHLKEAIKASREDISSTAVLGESLKLITKTSLILKSILSTALIKSFIKEVEDYENDLFMGR